MKNLTRQNPEQLFVAQELINKVKSKCCGIKAYKVFSMTGNLVSLGTLSADGEWHNVSEAKLPTGIYIIRVCDGKNNASAKIAVK